ncbi:MAG TPA: UV DNA damage repair endonuclease UvsE [Thermomicrobiales bacterium]|nr:UV DNA damage repair endonuclease UvsE [Thermomicrobiales bacterium]
MDGGRPPHRPARAQALNRLGFAVKVVGREGYKANDARRWQSGPHLRVSLEYLDRIFDYLDEIDIRMYRISSDIAPYVTHPDMPQFHNQIDECRDELAALGAKARRLELRLSMHPSQYIVLNSPDERIAAAAVHDFAYHADFLDGLGLDSDAKIVTHVGGVYGDRRSAMDRWVRAFEELPEKVRRRLVLENDEVSWPVVDTVAIHRRTAVPLVFDNLHHAVLNPAGIPEDEALRACVTSWPEGEMPKIHFSTQRVAEREVTRRVRSTGEKQTALQAAKPGQHDDYIDAGQFFAFLRRSEGLRFDVMLEAKQKDRALLALREALVGNGLAYRMW